jgi:BirA family biotin operon repressor/biotin-[acetyl-CoA-carboxylase] ligase
MEVWAVPIDIIDSTPSTMDVARERVLSGGFEYGSAPVSCACVMAREQTAGRGQRGRSWYAARDESLCATYMLHCPGVTEPNSSAHLGLLAGVAVAGALLRYGRVAVDSKSGTDTPGHETRPIVGLKWPNDFLLNGKKAGGVLVEMMKSPRGRWIALVGVGLNVSVRQFPPDLASSATSLLLEGVDIAALPALKEVAGDIGDSLVSWAHKCATDPHAVISMWRHLDATTGRRFETEWNGVQVTGTAEGIDGEGALLLRLDDGTPIAVTSASSLREAGW